MFDDHHECQASVSSHACRVDCHSRYPLCSLSSLDQGDCSPPFGVSEVAVLDFEFPFVCGIGTSVFVALALVVLLRYRCSSRVEPAALRVRRVRVNHSDDVRTDESNVAQSRISDRRAVFR